MTKNGKTAEQQRLAEALRANLRRRKAAQDSRAGREAAEAQKHDSREARADGVS